MKNALTYILNALLVVLTVILFIPAYLLVWIVEMIEKARFALGFNNQTFKEMFQKRN